MMEPYPPHVIAFVDAGSREQAAQRLDELCVQRDIAQVEGTAEELAALLMGIAELKTSIEACGWTLSFGPNGHEVQARTERA